MITPARSMSSNGIKTSSSHERPGHGCSRVHRPQMMEFLAALAGVRPIGLVHRPVPAAIQKPDSFVSADLLDRDGLHAAMVRVMPDAVIHLAGLTQGTPDALHATNVTGTQNLLDAALLANPDCRILVVSSSAVYGYAGESPIPETAPLRPVGDYGRSKVAQEEIAHEFAGSDAAVAITRPFNLAGPFQPETFVCGRIVQQVIAIEQGRRKALELRETISCRDLIDVRDVVRGYWALVSRADFSGDCAGKAFNLGSGNAYPIARIITLIEEISGESYPVRVPEVPPPIPVPSQRSDNSRILALTGWRPEYSLKETLRDMLAAARSMAVHR